MSTPSNIAAVTIALRDLIQTAMPPQVGVSTLPPAQAEKFRTRAGILARVNVALYQVSPEHRLRNISRSSPGSSPAEEPPPAKLVLGYLITAYGKAAPEQEHSGQAKGVRPSFVDFPH